MLNWADRDPKLKAPNDFTDTEQWYNYFVNDWIPNQKDADELMPLFIRCNFSPAAFVVCIKHGLDQTKLEIALDELRVKTDRQTS